MDFTAQTAATRPDSHAAPVAWVPAVGAAVASVAAFVLVRQWGLDLIDQGRRLELGAVPFIGSWETLAGPALMPAAALAVAVVVAGPVVARRVGFGWLVALSTLVAAAWAVALYGPDGWSAIGDPLDTPFEYLPLAGTVTSPGAFVDTFVERLGEYPIHVKGHPPGPVLAFWGLDQIGLSGARWAAAAVIAVGSSAVAAVLVALRVVASEEAARRAAPFLALAPAALWIATSADAMFLGVAAWGIALMALAVTDQPEPDDSPWVHDTLAVASGAVLALALHLSYGVAALLVVPAAMAVGRRRTDALVFAALGAAAVTGAFVAAGFWWFDGLSATRGFYEQGVASTRPYGYFVVANVVVFTALIGPAGWAALAALRDRAVWLVAGAGLAAVLAADLSGLSKGEVERIWLPFSLWVLTAAAAFPLRHWTSRAGLGANAAVALGLAATLRSPW